MVDRKIRSLKNDRKWSIESRKGTTKMCGIMGVMLDKRERSAREWRDLRIDITEVLLCTESRGQDAAGLFMVNGAGIAHYKAGMRAAKLIGQKQYWQLLDSLSSETTAVVGHTRYATMGKPSVNANNHPLISGNVVGVPNGMLSNTRELRKRFPHEAEVDSAAIFAMLDSMTKANPLDVGAMADAMTRLRGNYAVVAADVRNLGSLFFAKDAERPLVMFYEPERGLLWFASTAEIIDQGLPEELELVPDVWFNSATNTVNEITTENVQNMREGRAGITVSAGHIRSLPIA